ncbi:UPF0386 protein [Terasakiella brassicae]|uniref:UPF0386 protein n=1 Tax=Terasakiella brassicae TaxID=1634917 RepID=A0A917C1B6_9PROT|nr:YjhX family toxin [Terasakiella brassicae]GGF65149.1 UPF0386 protein [Terasakiella brassicae]
MNISKDEQRALHALAQGGAIHFKRATNGHVYDVLCFNRDGYALSGFTLETFRKLKVKRLIRSRKGLPYYITHEGRLRVNAQLDNR